MADPSHLSYTARNIRVGHDMFLHLNPFLYAGLMKWRAQKTMSFRVGHAMLQRIWGSLRISRTQEAPLRVGIARFTPCRQVWAGNIGRKPASRKVKGIPSGLLKDGWEIPDEWRSQWKNHL